SLGVGCPRGSASLLPSRFFPSRGRHTRWPRDWSSDVCSSDLFVALGCDRSWSALSIPITSERDESIVRKPEKFKSFFLKTIGARSEERRVGKEGSEARGGGSGLDVEWLRCGSVHVQLTQTSIG